MTEALTILSRDGLSCEAALDSPPDPKGVLVVCHPHPQMGGTMNAPLLLALKDDMARRGWAVLRFNFRGIGESEGKSSTGIDEIADAEGVLDEGSRRLPGLPLAIAGWSFGGAVAVRVAARHPELVGCVGIAPAVTEKPGVTAGLPPPAELGLEVPLLVVCGANDRQVSPEECARWAEEAGADLEVMPGANHFFWAKYEQLAEVVGDWLDTRIHQGHEGAKHRPADSPKETR